MAVYKRLASRQRASEIYKEVSDCEQRVKNVTGLFQARDLCTAEMTTFLKETN